MYPTYTFFPPNFSPKTARSDFFDRILFLGIPAVGEAQNRIRKAKRDARNEFYIFF